MVELYGKSYSRAQIEAAGGLAHAAGVRMMVLDNGVERGNRVLEFRSGTGLRFTVMIDRAMDIGDCDHGGRGIGWQSPAGFRHPSLHEYEGESGWAGCAAFRG